MGGKSVGITWAGNSSLAVDGSVTLSKWLNFSVLLLPHKDERDEKCLCDSKCSPTLVCILAATEGNELLLANIFNNENILKLFVLF